MSFINENFNNVEDLLQLDEKIGELMGLNAKIKSIAEFKVNGEPVEDNGSKPVENPIDLLSNDRLKAAVDDIVTKIRQLQDFHQLNNLGQSIEIVGQLNQKYGPVEIVTNIKSYLETKVQISKNLKYLDLAKIVETELNDNLVNFSQLSSEIHILRQNSNPLSNETMAVIDDLLNKRVMETKVQLEQSLTNLLQENNWLVHKNTNLPSDAMKPIRELIEKLVDLQCINDVPQYPHTWWVLDILLKPIFTRFDYHFNSSRNTDKISRPELALGFIDTFLQDNLPVLNLIIGNVFRSKQRILEFEVITTLLKPLRVKFLKIVKIINNNIKLNLNDPSNLEKSGQLLAHLIKELSDFDHNLRRKYKYNPYVVKFDQVPSEIWEGITGDIFSHDEENIDNWLSLEKRLALKQLNEQIINSSDKYKIDIDYQGVSVNNEQELKPTMSALNLTKLINNLTSHFQTLTSPSSQLKFVNSIHLTLLDSYYDDLLLILKAFNEKFNQKSVFSFIPGGMKPSKDVSENHLVNGMKALDMILGLYCSAQFVFQSLEQWENELCFIQISQTGGYEIFASCIRKYQDLVKRILKNFEDFYRKEIQFTLKNYVNGSVWDHNTSSNDQVASSDLNLLVRTLSVYLNEIQKCVSTLQYVYMTNRTVSTIFNILNDYVVHNNQFTKLGLQQLKTDVSFIKNQLHSTLYLNSSSDFSNDTNLDVIKLNQSIEVLDRIKSYEAKSFITGGKSLQELRDMFDDSLDQLTGHDLLGLLPRIL